MTLRRDDQQWREQLLNIANRGSADDMCTFLQSFNRRPFQSLAEALTYQGVIDDQIDFIDATSTRYSITPLIIAAGKGAFEKVKVLLVHGANPNKQCATGDSALNLAAHRQKCDVVNLLLEYRANPNVYNQAGKTALHRAVVSYSDENAHHVQALLLAGADTTLEDRNQRMPLDEAVLANRSEVLSVLLAHDRSLVQRAYRAAIIAARLGHDKCLENLLNYGMDPDITDQTNNTPLHVAVRSSKLSTARLLVANGADPSKANNRGETAVSIARQLPLDRQANFLNLLDDAGSIGSTDFNRYTSENAVPYVHPLLRSQPNWTLDDGKHRSPTAENSSVENLLDTSSGTYWCSTKAKDAWVIFDLKHQYSISGIRVIGCNNESTPREIQLEVANAFNGPWLKVNSFTCSPAYPNKNDFFYSPLKTRFLRVVIRNNYGGDDIRVQGIGFYGVDTRLVNLLQAHGLEKSLNTLLASGINDQEALDEHRDEILNSSDSYLPLNDHFRFLNLTKSLPSSQLTFLEWLDPPQTTAIAGNIFPTFSVIGDEGVTDRVKLEEQLETSPQARTVMLRDLEPIQDYSLVDFPDYIIKAPGRYKIRVVSVESPDIQTSWQEIVVGPHSFYASKLTSAVDERPLSCVNNSLC